MHSSEDGLAHYRRISSRAMYSELTTLATNAAADDGVGFVLQTTNKKSNAILSHDIYTRGRDNVDLHYEYVLH